MYTQQILPAIAPGPLSAYLQLAPVAPNISQPPAAVPTGQSWCNLATADAQAPTTYPPPRVERVGVSYRQEPIPELLKKGNNEWTLCLPISIPSDLINPTLASLAYYIKYATTHNNRDSTVQTDIILTTKYCPSGIILDPTDLVVYCNATGHAPRMVDEEVTVRLLSVTSKKCNGGAVQSSHHTDHHYITPNIRVVEASNLYLAFHVFECPTAETLRSLTVEISATWQDDALERKRREDERREEEKKKAEEAKKAEEERRRMIEEEEKAEEARKAEEEQKKKAEEARKAEEERKRKEEEKKKAEEAKVRASPVIEVAPSIMVAPRRADSDMQQVIAETVKKFNLEPCPNGFAWSEEGSGYRCHGGQHFVSFEQLGVRGGQRTPPLLYAEEVNDVLERVPVAEEVYHAPNREADVEEGYSVQYMR